MLLEKIYKKCKDVDYNIHEILDIDELYEEYENKYDMDKICESLLRLYKINDRSEWYVLITTNTYYPKYYRNFISEITKNYGTVYIKVRY